MGWVYYGLAAALGFLVGFGGVLWLLGAISGIARH